MPLSEVVRCWCCNSTYPNPHKAWCLDIKLVCAQYDKRMRMRKPPKVKRVPKPKPFKKKCALCRCEVLEGAFCSELCRSDAWRLFSQRTEHVSYGNRRRTFSEGSGSTM